MSESNCSDMSKDSKAVPPRSFVQLRPMTGGIATDMQVYAPHRDLAHNFPSLAAHAVSRLRPEGRSAWLTAMIEKLDVSDEAVGATLLAFVQAVTMMHKRECASPEVALTQTGFMDAPAEAQLIVTACFGQVMYGAVFAAIREVTAAGERPPMSEGIAKLVAIAESLADVMTCGGAAGASAGRD